MSLQRGQDLDRRKTISSFQSFAFPLSDASSNVVDACNDVSLPGATTDSRTNYLGRGDRVSYKELSNRTTYQIK